MNVLNKVGHYLGSKDWSLMGYLLTGKTQQSGYHRQARMLTPAQAKKFEATIAMAQANFNSNGNGLLSKYNIAVVKPTIDTEFGAIKKTEKCLFDPTTGLKVMILKHGQTTYVTFGCIYSMNPEFRTEVEQKEVVSRQYTAITKNFVGLDARIFHQAEEILGEIQKEEPDVTLIGNCFGGTIAQYVGLKKQVPVVALNAFPMGAGLQDNIGPEKLSQADNWVKHLIVKGDQFADNRIINIFDRFLSFIGVRTPGNFGMRYTIPSAFDNKKDTHERILDSLKIYIGEKK